MRLGQLARKLAIRPSDIVEFLAGKSIQTEEGTNTKLSDEEVKLIAEKFAPDQVASLLNQDTPFQEETTPSVPVTVEEKEPFAEVSEPVNEDIVLHTETEPTEKREEPEKIEVIKAPKVELAGLKVLGKIELPQPKKKEITPVENTETTIEGAAVEQSKPEKKPRRENRKDFSQHKDRRRENKPRKNPIALQREQEAREAEEKRREEAKQKKEQRTNYYLERVKTSAPTKPARLYDEPVLQMKDHQTKKEPKTWLGKFWRWYTS